MRIPLVFALLVGCTRAQPPAGSCLPGAPPGPDTPWWYPDGDADGVGGDSGKQACEQPDGFVPLTGDCDDSDPARHPGARELCDDVDEDCDGDIDEDALDAAAWHPDADGDGFGDSATTVRGCLAPAGAIADGADCDDSDPAIHPGAEELCDGLDGDCDGADDEVDPDVVDPATWYADVDGDGFGDETSEILACFAGTGRTDDSSDCDDTRADIHPGAPERCDGRDGDCNGRVDDAADDATAWFVDGDGDGFGSSAFTVTACEAPASFVVDATDCDDGNAGVHPGAIEVCDNLDGDCDGTVDDESVDATAWYPDLDGDGFADLAGELLACDRPAGWLELEDATDCDDADDAIHPEAVEGCDDGVDADCDGFERPCPLASSVDVGASVGAVWYGETAGARAGESVAWADTNGDGLDEAIIGVFQDSRDATFAGAVHMVVSLGTGATDLASATARLSGTNALDYAGKAVAGAGDVDGDGYEELLVGALGASANASNAGAAYLVSGPVVSMELSLATATMNGEFEDDEAGSGVAGVGDLDGDGLDDIAVTAPGYDGDYESGGVIYVNLGPVSGTFDLDRSYSRLFGASQPEQIWRLGAGDDVDGDGVGDFVAGAPKADGAQGAVYLITSVPAGDSSLADATARMTGLASGDNLGYACAIAGDVDGDGYADILAGGAQSDENGTDAGAVYLVSGPILGDFDLALAEATFLGQNAGDFLGKSVSTAGDVDGDTRADMLLGASGEDEAGTTAGAVYVLLGPLSGTSPVEDAAYAKLVPFTGVTESGSSVAGGGDMDGDGWPEVLWGGPDFGYYRGGAGGAFILPGSEL